MQFGSCGVPDSWGVFLARPCAREPNGKAQHSGCAAVLPGVWDFGLPLANPPWLGTLLGFPKTPPRSPLPSRSIAGVSERLTVFARNLE